MHEPELFDYVSNTYLVFKKAKKEFDYLFDYENDKVLNNMLVDDIKGICLQNIINDDILHNITTLREFEQFEVCNEYYYDNVMKQGFNLLFVEYGTNRILLNYLKAPRKFNPVDEYYIPNALENEDFIGEVDLQGKEYNIINTFDSFIKYSELHDLPLSRNSNEDFFYYLAKAIEYNNIPITNGTINSVEYLWNIYKYMVIDDVILIIDYDCPEYLND